VGSSTQSSAQPLAGQGHGFGSWPVFLASISTILGAILFLRFGYAVGTLGLPAVLLIILLGHIVTLPTAMAVSEIATNQRVAGGGVYYIISRSFGLNIGAAIGISLFLSQAISVAFYIIAFAEAFRPLNAWLADNYGIVISDNRLISLPSTVILTVLMLLRGADLGVKALWVVVAILFVSLALFFVGDGYGDRSVDLVSGLHYGDDFFVVFAICFPAFTGMTAGVGLSGDLAKPERSIPIGTMAGTVVGMLIYAGVAYKLAVAAPQDDLLGDPLVMSKIAVWGPIIPIGLACATLSSALGSILVAPRTLQALGNDQVLPLGPFNDWLARGRGATNEPINATLITAVIAILFVAAGDVDFVAQVISMFFMVSYGSICLISFLEHFAADPAYRPAFRSRWYLSAMGALASLWLMMKMNFFYSMVSFVIMVLLYVWISRTNPNRPGMARLFQGAMFQVSRKLQVFVQKASEDADGEASWRPSVVCISGDSFERMNAFDFLRFVSHRYGFGTYIHYLPGYLSKASHEQAREALRRLVHRADVSHSNVYIDTMISPSYTTAIAQILQLPGVSGKENNLLLLEFPHDSEGDLQRVAENYQLAAAADFDVCLLSSSDRGFGYRREIHIWITPHDVENASLMILLGYILLGHEEWKGGVIKIFALTPESGMDEQRANLRELVRTGRLPISIHNIEMVPAGEATTRQEIVSQRSRDADLVLLGFRGEALKHEGIAQFQGYTGVGNVLFVNSRADKGIV